MKKVLLVSLLASTVNANVHNDMAEYTTLLNTSAVPYSEGVVIISSEWDVDTHKLIEHVGTYLPIDKPFLDRLEAVSVTKFAAYRYTMRDSYILNDFKYEVRLDTGYSDIRYTYGN